LVLLLDCLFQEMIVLDRSAKLLGQTERLVEVHRHGNFRKVFSYRILEDSPYTDLEFGILKEW